MILNASLSTGLASNTNSLDGARLTNMPSKRTTLSIRNGLIETLEIFQKLIGGGQVPDFDLFTYSSPCQDFSQAGLQRGGTRGSGTRSSLLWECEKAITIKRPKYLLMENVAALVSGKFIKLFNQWQLTLERLGYKQFAKVLDAKDFGVPQHRERVFLVSILDENDRFEFPKPRKLERRLKDVLEQNVDEKYYINASGILKLQEWGDNQKEKGRGFIFKPKTDDDICANSLTTKCGGGRQTDNFVMQ